MSDLNFKTDASRSYAGDKIIVVPGHDTAANTGTTARLNVLGRVQRRRASSRPRLADSGFRLFRVY